MDTDGFLKALAAVNKRAPSTIESYGRELNHFNQFVSSKRLRASQIKPSVIVDYMKSRDPKGYRRPATTGRRLAVLSKFFDYIALTSNGRIRNPVTVIARPKKQPPRPLPADPISVATLLEGITNDRDRVIISLFLSSGLRIAELCSLDRDSIVGEVTELTPDVKRVLGVGRIIGKGDKEREFLVDFETLRKVHEYLKTRSDGSPAMFVSRRGKRISIRTVRHMLSYWCSKLGLGHLHPHQLRARFATDLRRLGVPTKEISQLLGHASVATLEAYLGHDPAKIRAEYFAAFEARH